MQEEPEPGQQPEEDDAKGVEMDADFEGTMHDVPSGDEGEDDDGEEPDQEQQRLDQEMGDVGDAGQARA